MYYEAMYCTIAALGSVALSGICATCVYFCLAICRHIMVELTATF